MAAPSDAHCAIAFVARHQGRPSMPASRWAHVLSLELAWLSPTDAKRFVEAAEQADLLAADDDGLHPTFPWRDVEVPRGFRLQDAAVPAAPADPFLTTVGRIAAARGVERDVVLQDVQARQAAMGGLLEAEAAVLWLAAEAGLDVADEARAALDRLTSSSLQRA